MKRWVPSPAPMPLPDPAVIGRRTPLAIARPGSTAGSVVAARRTQLISMRDVAPRQWIVTVMQTVKQASGVSPWLSTQIDGFPWPNSGIFTAPDFPGVDKVRMALRWGAGGASFETRVDYPIAGGVFGLTADSFDLDVEIDGTEPEFPDRGELPIVGAFMVQGQAADPTPLRWRDVQASAVPENSRRAWAIKPYARTMRMQVDVANPSQYIVEWLDRAGNVLEEDQTWVAGGAVNRAFSALPCQCRRPRV